MMGTQNLGLYVLSAFLLNMTPGQDTFYILGRSAAQGTRAGLLSVASISSGSAVHTMAAAFGLSALLATSAAAFTVVKLLGAGYLIYLGRPDVAGTRAASGRGRRAAAGEFLGHLSRGLAHERDEPQGRAVLSGFHSSVRRTRRRLKDVGVSLPGRSLHHHQHALVRVPRRRGCPSSAPPAGWRRNRRRDQTSHWSHLRRFGCEARREQIERATPTRAGSFIALLDSPRCAGQGSARQESGVPQSRVGEPRALARDRGQRESPSTHGGARLP
jgi:hypothetical protein